MKEIIELKCGYKAYKNAIPEKFLYICTPSTGFSLNKTMWEKDLYDHYIEGLSSFSTNKTFFPTRHNGKILLWLNSLEELYEVAKFFNKRGFRTSYGECSGRFNKDWIWRDKDYVGRRGDTLFELYVHIKNKSSYIKFRELLLSKELKDLGYYVNHEVDRFPGIYVKDWSTSTNIIC